MTGLRKIIVSLALACAARAFAGSSDSQRLVIDLDPGKGAPAFRPDEALGAAIDGAQEGDIARHLSSRNITAMKSAGLRPLTYRLRTELGIEAWHWNPAGKWSDPAHRQGYWTSSDAPRAPIGLSWGYRLPRRGDTIDNANDDDYSRLTDGDRETFWKSNPYLDPAVLHDGEGHPQWLVVRLDRDHLVDTAVIDWGEPFASHYTVQYWTGREESDPAGRWADFPCGVVTVGKGGRVVLPLADRPLPVRFLRVMLQAASGTAPAGAADWRDRMGYAVREVSFGTMRPDGTLNDAVVHAASHTGQTFSHVSSTDPWHRASDLDRNLEQVGIDRLFASGLGFGLPVMIPTGLLFDTPENAAAELRYIARRRYPVRQIELGEEPDGQYGVPADYGALYVAAVRRLRGIVPGAIFGGPSLQSAFSDVLMQPEAAQSWNGGFVSYLKRQNRLGDLGFVSFEYYPFDDICGNIHAKLIRQSEMLDEAAGRLNRDGVPPQVPRIITEYGFSAYSGRAMAEMPSALLMAGIAGQWLSLGGGAAYMFGYPPDVPINQHQPCAGYGNMMLFQADVAGRAAMPMPSLHTARLLTRQWTLPGHGLHHVLPAWTEGIPGDEVKAYAVRRPDHRIAVLIINRSADNSYELALLARHGSSNALAMVGPAHVYRFSPENYAWQDAGPQSRPIRSTPATRSAIPAGPARLTAPAQSITVAILRPGR